MNNRQLSLIAIIILFTGIFTAFITVANANCSKLLCSNNQKMVVTLKNDAKVETSKEEILAIPQVKITKITYRDKEWSKMVNKMDLPRMENPFKNEFTIKINKKANSTEIYNTIKKMDFVEDIQYISDKNSSKGQK